MACRLNRASVEDAEFINGLVAEQMWEADFTPFLSNPLNVALIAGRGVACFVWHGPGVYEVHCCFTQRGKEVREISKEILSVMRRDFDAKLIWAAIPDESRKVKIYVRWLGFRPAGPIALPQGPCELFVLEN